MPTPRIANARAHPEYAPGLEPYALDPVLRALIPGHRVSENVIRAALDLPPLPRRQRHAPPKTLAHHPRLMAHQRAKGGAFYPDEVTDTRSKRRRDAVKPLARLERLAAQCSDGLKLYRLDLSDLDPLDLYDTTTVKLATRAVLHWLRARGLRGEWKLERGLNGGIHVHIVTCASAGAGGVDVYDLAGLAEYLVKPADARACLPKRDDLRRPWQRRADHDAAAEDYLRALEDCAAGRYGKRAKLPRMLRSG